MSEEQQDIAAPQGPSIITMVVIVFACGLLSFFMFVNGPNSKRGQLQEDLVEAQSKAPPPASIINADRQTVKAARQALKPLSGPNLVKFLKENADRHYLDISVVDETKQPLEVTVTGPKFALIGFLKKITDTVSKKGDQLRGNQRMLIVDNFTVTNLGEKSQVTAQISTADAVASGAAVPTASE